MIFSLFRGGAMKMEQKVSPAAPARVRRQRPGRSTLAGFTLTEVLVAMLVLAVGCMAVINMQTAGMNAGARAANMAVATFLAESQAEWLKTIDVNRVQFVSQAPEKLDWDGSPCPDSATEFQCFTRTTKTACFTPTSRSCEISVNVEWQAADGKKTIYYETVVSAYGF